MTMGCLARDFLPVSVQFSWDYQNNTEIDTQVTRTFPPVMRDEKSAATSQVFLPSADILLQGTDEFVMCKVSHVNGNKSVKVPFPGETGCPHLSQVGKGGARPG